MSAAFVCLSEAGRLPRRQCPQPLVLPGVPDAGSHAQAPLAGTYLGLQPESTAEPGSGLRVQHRMESWVYLLFSQSKL